VVSPGSLFEFCMLLDLANMRAWVCAILPSLFKIEMGSLVRASMRCRKLRRRRVGHEMRVTCNSSGQGKQHQNISIA